MCLNGMYRMQKTEIEGIYDPNSDHRRKGVYKQDIDNLKNRNTTLQTLVEAILNYDEEDVLDLVRQMRSSDDLEAVAESILQRRLKQGASEAQCPLREDEEITAASAAQFESELAGKMSELRLDGTVKYVGGTSNLVFLPTAPDTDDSDSCLVNSDCNEHLDDSITCWTTITKSKELIRHLLTMYFTWHYPYFTTLSKRLFYRDYVRGRSSQYCSALLVNAMLALGCHFSTWPTAREDPNDSATAGDHFFREAKRLILENDEHEKARLCNVQAFALMSVREAGCGREGSGWVYSGMSFRMACDLGLNVDVTGIGSNRLRDEDIDARRVTFWGCYLFDKCWSNYLGRQPQLSGAQITVPKFDVFLDEDSETWSPYTDAGVSQDHVQPARTRAVSLQISELCEISSDLMCSFYNPTPITRHMGKQEELRRLSQLHTRLEAWRKNLPKELEPKDGQLPQVLLMQPFLKYTKATSPLPQHVSPRKLCTQSASMISKLLRIYKRSYGLRQICNVAVYIVHSACTIHLLNLPDKAAKRDIIYGVKNLEEIAESWLCARRTLRILDLSAQKWHVSLPAEAAAVLERSHNRFGSWASWDQVNSPSTSDESVKVASQDVASASSTRASTPDSTPNILRSDLQPSEIRVSVNSTMPQLVRSIPSTPHDGAVTSAPLAKHLQCNPSLSEAPAEPCQYADGHVRLKLESPSPPADMTMMNTTTANLSAPQNPAFTNIVNLVEESQDWWFKDQNALALGLDNWDWVSSDRACGNIDVNHTMSPTTSPTPNFGDSTHIIPSQVSGVVNSTIGIPVTSNTYSGGYYMARSGPEVVSGPRAFPMAPPESEPSQIYYQ
ncbi:hypothetical protein PRK78_006468 [Emydomyces testavorans]|uniref:Xylanolytic transcriptional activator regulatory domain-containing protein n=1 Tax=Emydomyces testavorans TaxID=2070801 RepID=A0AAF0DMG7_9EURO|nr:hypothetical protein PRK78_006468 [Emydomyces testavorans]